MYSVVLVCGLSPEGSDANLPLRTTMPMDFAVFQKGGIVSSLVLRTFRFAPSPPRLSARCPPLTAAGGQGPQDNTAYGLRINPQWPSHACQHGPPTNRSLRSPLTSLEGTTNLSSCIGLSTIIRHGAIYHRAAWDHRLSHGWPFSNS